MYPQIPLKITILLSIPFGILLGIQDVFVLMECALGVAGAAILPILAGAFQRRAGTFILATVVFLCSAFICMLMTAGIKKKIQESTFYFTVEQLDKYHAAHHAYPASLKDLHDPFVFNFMEYKPDADFQQFILHYNMNSLSGIGYNSRKRQYEREYGD